METPDQEVRDRFYWSNGPCCAGCDWWQALNSSAGSCTKAAPVSGGDRLAMLGMESASLLVGAGYPLTRRADGCGEFRDEFDWSALPLVYRKRIGAPTT